MNYLKLIKFIVLQRKKKLFFLDTYILNVSENFIRKTEFIIFNVSYSVCPGITIYVLASKHRHEVTEVWEKWGTNPITYKIIIVAAGKWLRWSQESSLSCPFPLEILNNCPIEEGGEFQSDQW